MIHSSTQLGLTNGGFAGMVWLNVISATGFLITILSLAEMNSM